MTGPDQVSRGPAPGPGDGPTGPTGPPPSSGDRRFVLALIVVAAAILLAGALWFIIGGNDDAPETAPILTTAVGPPTDVPGPQPDAGKQADKEPAQDGKTDDGQADDDGGDHDHGSVADPALFSLDDGNITCTMEEIAVSCEIGKHDFKPPSRPDDCPAPAEWGSRISVGSGGVAFACHEDRLPSAESHSVIADGDVLQVGNDYRCNREKDSITCLNVTTSRGFNLSRTAYELF